MKRILIVEDDTSISELERDYLEVAGFETEIAGDGEEGLRLALGREYDLILLDMMLPGRSGFEVCRELRAQKEIPILMVSAKKDDIDKIRGLGLGADDYIIKPFSPSELVARVNAHLSRYDRLTSRARGAAREQEITVRQLKIWPKARRAALSGEEIKLANKEFELLLFFVNNPNIVFSKDTLFDRVWGMDSLGDASTVTVHVNRLREKIDPAGHSQFIETVWGSGYRFRM